MYCFTRLFYYYHFFLHRNGLGYINKEDGRELVSVIFLCESKTCHLHILLHLTTTTTLTTIKTQLCLFSTSNHNEYSQNIADSLLSFISFLHQTTTHFHLLIYFEKLSFISFLHQTTTRSLPSSPPMHCLLSLFYIKPQRIELGTLAAADCLLSLFYIKPQLVVL